MKSLITSIIFFTITFPATAQSLKHTYDVAVEFGNKIPVQSFYIETETKGGVKDANGNDVADYFTPTEVEFAQNIQVDLYSISGNLYKIGNYDVFMRLDKEPNYTKGVLQKHGEHFVYIEIKGEKYDPRPCRGSDRQKSTRFEEGEDHSRGI